jgi:F420-non-reducing hydrogenase iron-sulfur subunit
MHRLLEFTGVESGRLYVDWVSASEGRKFADVVTHFTEQVRALGPAPMKRERRHAYENAQEPIPEAVP